VRHLSTDGLSSSPSHQCSSLDAPLSTPPASYCVSGEKNTCREGWLITTEETRSRVWHTGHTPNESSRVESSHSHACMPHSRNLTRTGAEWLRIPAKQISSFVPPCTPPSPGAMSMMSTVVAQGGKVLAGAGAVPATQLDACPSEASDMSWRSSAQLNRREQSVITCTTTNYELQNISSWSLIHIQASQRERGQHSTRQASTCKIIFSAQGFEHLRRKSSAHWCECELKDKNPSVLAQQHSQAR
jgi:hypothetical protein